MSRKQVRIALLVCSVVAVATLNVWADDKAPDAKPEPIKAPAVVAPADAAPLAAPAMGGCGCGAPAYKTVCVTEWVPENYTATRTVYKKECVAERYTAYRTECTPEVRTRTVTVMHKETYQEEVCKTVCVCTPVQEQRTITKKVVTCVPVTTMTCKTVDHGHYECREEACGPTLGERLGGLFAKRHSSCDSGCGCDSGCNSGCGCETACAPRTKTVKVWVACKETIQVPCTHMERHVECVPETVCVTVNKMIPTTQKVMVCKTRCVPECKTEQYTVMVSHCVPYEATRNVTRCVPVCETYTACRMVAHQVEKQVACGCDSGCGSSSSCGCEAPRSKFFSGGLLHKLRGHGGECGCEAASCGCGCH